MCTSFSLQPHQKSYLCRLYHDVFSEYLKSHLSHITFQKKTSESNPRSYRVSYTSGLYRNVYPTCPFSTVNISDYQPLVYCSFSGMTYGYSRLLVTWVLIYVSCGCVPKGLRERFREFCLYINFLPVLPSLKDLTDSKRRTVVKMFLEFFMFI